MEAPLMCDRLARLCLQCDGKLHSETVKHLNDSRIPSCNNYVSKSAVVQCLGLCPCQTRVLNPNYHSSSYSSSFINSNSLFSNGSLPFSNEESSLSFENFQIDENYIKNSYISQQVPMFQNGANLAYNGLDFDCFSSSNSSSFVNRNSRFSDGSLPIKDSSSSFEIDGNYTKKSYISQQVPMLQNGAKLAYNGLDFDSSSSSYSFVDRNSPFSDGSLPLIHEDSPSYFEIFQMINEYSIKNKFSDPQVPMLQHDNLDIPKDWSFACCNGYNTKRDIENILPNTIDGDEAELDLIKYNLGELTTHSAETTSTKIISSSSLGMSSVTYKDWNIEALHNAGSQGYYIDPIIGSVAKEETNNLAIFPNALVQLDHGQSQFTLTDEMLPWENQTYVLPKTCTPQEKVEKIKRYLAKRKNRKFVKQIRYTSRKSTADMKRRMKGRFTKAGAEYDYDPRANNVKKETNKTMS